MTTKTLAHQQRTDKKRIKISDGIELLNTGTAEEGEITRPKTVMSYLSLLFTYLLAWAKAGVNPIPSAPTETPKNKVESTLMQPSMWCGHTMSVLQGR